MEYNIETTSSRLLKVSDTIAKTFESTCQQCKDFMDIMMNQGLPMFDKKREVTLETGYHGIQVVSLDDKVKGIYLAEYESTPIVFDTGASINVSNNAYDFIQWDSKVPRTSFQGITTNAEVKGTGTVRWMIETDQGKRKAIETTAYFVPDSHLRLLIPQRLIKKRQAGGMVITNSKDIFVFEDKSTLTFKGLRDGTVGLPLEKVSSPKQFANFGHMFWKQAMRTSPQLRRSFWHGTLRSGTLTSHGFNV